MSKKNSNELVTTKTSEVAEFVAPEFIPEAVHVEDIAFPRLLLMQPISETVTDGKYAAGGSLVAGFIQVLGE